MSLAETKSDRPVDFSVGNLRIRLAEGPAEVRAAQALRYRVFYEQMAATATPEMRAAGLDFDSFDEYCDHLVVFDEERGSGPEAVVATYRVMRREGAARRGQFYTRDEYDISVLESYPGEVLELGRSCVDPMSRSGAAMQLLWRGITQYVFFYDIGIMFGCASLPGVNPEDLKLPLSYLYHHHLAPPAIRARAVPERYVDMNLMPVEEVQINAARQALPPLIKGYLRLGGFVGDGAVVDHDFGTTDVCIVVKTEWVTEKYRRHYARDDGASGAGAASRDSDKGTSGGASGSSRGSF